MCLHCDLRLLLLLQSNRHSDERLQPTERVVLKTSVSKWWLHSAQAVFRRRRDVSKKFARHEKCKCFVDVFVPVLCNRIEQFCAHNIINHWWQTSKNVKRDKTNRLKATQVIPTTNCRPAEEHKEEKRRATRWNENGNDGQATKQRRWTQRMKHSFRCIFRTQLICICNNCRQRLQFPHHLAAVTEIVYSTNSFHSISSASSSFVDYWKLFRLFFAVNEKRFVPINSGFVSRFSFGASQYLCVLITIVSSCYHT